MNKSVFILLLVLVLVGNKDALAAGTPVLPNPKLFHSEITKCISLFDSKISDADNIYPENVVIDIQNKQVTGFIFTFGDDVKYEQLRRQLDAQYAKWAVSELNNKKLDTNIWRVTPDKFTISLAKDELGKVQVIFIVWSPGVQR